MSNQEEPKNDIVSIENITGSALVNKTEWQKKIQEVKDSNPLIEITDNVTYEAAKKNRTAVKSFRVSIDKQDTLIASTFAKIRKNVGEITKDLLSEITPFEEEHEASVKVWEDRKEKERKEKEEAENLRIEAIKNKVVEIENGCNELIAGMQIDSVSDTHKQVCEILNQEFDYEEYDILHTQAQNRVLAAFDAKQKELREKEAQRAENERLARQNERLEKLYPVIAFAQGVEIMNLHALSEESFTAVLSNANEAKAESDRKAEEAQAEADRIAKEREEKAKEEKEKVFVIRKQRLLDLGMAAWVETETGDNKDFIQGSEKLKHHTCQNFEISFSQIMDADTIDFENIFNDAKKAISDAQEEKALKERFEKRISVLVELGFKEHKIDPAYIHDDVEKGILSWHLSTISDDDFEKAIENFKGQISLAEEKREETRKASDKRQKALKADKGRVIAYVASLEFRDAVPNFKNSESEQMLKEVEQRFSEFKEYIVEYVNKF